MNTSKTVSRGSREDANFGVIILILLSLGLCGLAAYQWTRETTFRKGIETLRQTNVVLMTLQNEAEHKATRYQVELADVEKRRADLVAENRTNRLRLGKLEVEISKLEANLNYSSNLVIAFSNGVQNANQSIRIQNQSISNLNSEFKKLAEDRNDVVKRYNARAQDQQKTVEEYNKLVKQFEDFQKQVEEQLNPRKDKN
jgi:chromosome segregation ATPase